MLASFCYRPVGPQLMPQLYGEWSLWHSNDASFKGPNRVLVYLHPDDMIDVCHTRHVGPFLVQDKRIGRWRGIDDENTECVISGLDSICTGDVHVDFHSSQRRLMSIMGIGINDCPLAFENKIMINIRMRLHVVGRDDLFLTSTMDDGCYYHLIRSIRTNQPSVDIPFSTLMSTQLVSMLITYILHIIAHHK